RLWKRVERDEHEEEICEEPVEQQATDEKVEVKIEVEVVDEKEDEGTSAQWIEDITENQEKQVAQPDESQKIAEPEEVKQEEPQREEQKPQSTTFQEEKQESAWADEEKPEEPIEEDKKAPQMPSPKLTSLSLRRKPRSPSQSKSSQNPPGYLNPAGAIHCLARKRSSTHERALSSQRNLNPAPKANTNSPFPRRPVLSHPHHSRIVPSVCWHLRAVLPYLLTLRRASSAPWGEARRIQRHLMATILKALPMVTTTRLHPPMEIRPHTRPHPPIQTHPPMQTPPMRIRLHTQILPRTGILLLMEIRLTVVTLRVLTTAAIIMLPQAEVKDGQNHRNLKTADICR
ncbi:hypothetical protein AARAC_000952, partial [Aspergillus arachidicola]